MRTLFSILSIACLTMLIGIVPAHAESIILSTTSDATLGGLTFKDGDLIEYNPVTKTSSLFFSEGFFAGDEGEGIDAVNVLANGNIILSTIDGATLGGLTFKDGDLVEYNPVTKTSSLFFNEGLSFPGNEDIDAVCLLDNGNIILSTIGDATLGGLSFEDGDLIEYNPVAKTSSLFFSEGHFFPGDEDIDAIHLLSNGNIILSTKYSATLRGLSFKDGDLIEYNPTTDASSLFFSENFFSDNSDNEDIDAICLVNTDSNTVPEPMTLSLLGLGLFGIGAVRIKIKKGRR